MEHQRENSHKNVEASFMMMNQVDSSNFDNDKDDGKKPKRMISRLSQQVQDQV